MSTQKVFISGSIAVKKLDNEVLSSLQKMMQNGLQILVGDAKGVDSQIQDVNTKLSQAVTTLQNGVVSSVEGKKGEVNLWDVLHRYGENYVPTDTSNVGWNSLGVCIIFYTQFVIKNQPAQFGQLINIPANKNMESMQIWVNQYGGQMYTRGGNASISVNDRAFTPLGREDRVYLTTGAQIWVE